MTFSRPKMRGFRRNLITALAPLALLAAFGATGCASDDIGVGDYQVFRVAFTATSPEASCYVDGQIPQSIVEDSTSLRSGGTFIMYSTEEGGLYLDTGSMVLEGTLDGDTYEFDGSVIDVEFPASQTIFDSDHDGIDDNSDPFVDSDADGLDDNNGADDFVDVDLDGLDDRFQDDIVDANNDLEDDRYVDLASSYKFRTVQDYSIDITIVDDVVTGDTKTAFSTSCEGTGCPLEYGTSCVVRGEFEGVVIKDAQVDVALGAPANGIDDGGAGN